MAKKKEDATPAATPKGRPAATQPPQPQTPSVAEKSGWEKFGVVVSSLSAVVAVAAAAVSVGAKSTKIDEAYSAAVQARADIANVRQQLGEVQGELRRVRAEVRSDAGVSFVDASAGLPFALTNTSSRGRRGVRIDFNSGRRILLAGVPGVGLVPESDAPVLDAGVAGYPFEAWRVLGPREGQVGICARVDGVTYCYAVNPDGRLEPAGESLRR